MASERIWHVWFRGLTSSDTRATSCIISSRGGKAEFDAHVCSNIRPLCVSMLQQSHEETAQSFRLQKAAVSPSAEPYIDDISSLLLINRQRKFKELPQKAEHMERAGMGKRKWARKGERQKMDGAPEFTERAAQSWNRKEKEDAVFWCDKSPVNTQWLPSGKNVKSPERERQRGKQVQTQRTRGKQSGRNGSEGGASGPD